MTIRCYIQTIAKRAEIVALADSGATENFMNLTYAKWLKLPIKRLPKTRKLYNVDGTENKAGELQFYTDLEVRTGKTNTRLRFFLTELGEHKAILGYSWFAAAQPKIDWKKGWIDHSQLPIILKAPDARKAVFTSRHKNTPRSVSRTQYYIGSTTIHPQTMQSRDLMDVPDELKQNVLQEVPDEYKRHRQVFDEEKSQRLPRHSVWDHAIELLPNAPATLPGRLLPLTQTEQAEMSKFVQEHLKRGTIRESWSPYAANFFFIKKRDGKLRPVQDYRPINKWTRKNRNSMPLIPQTIDRLMKCTLFTKFDVRWGYNNVRIKPGDEWKAAFLTHEGLFEPTVMFFGLTNSPATFQMMMNTIFRKEVAQGWLSVYMDDIAIHSKPNKEETDAQHKARHADYTHLVLDKLEANDLYLKPEKCEFDREEIEYLGVIVGKNRIRIHPKKLKGVEDWPTPHNPTGVRQFLGFTGYYRYFVPNYSKIARPLLELTRKDTVWHWNNDQQKAFDELKTRMCTSPVLTQPDFDKRFFLQTDASAYGVGAVLSQEGELTPTLAKRQKPTLHPISYYSATFTPTEHNYDIYERELLAIMKSLAHWRPYLGWTKHPFLILTDHANLQYWKSPKNLNRRTARWHADLQEYDYEIKHVPGKTNIPADALSRPLDADQGKEDNQDITLLPSSKFINVVNSQPTINHRQKQDLMERIHDHPTAGHPGRDETIRKAKQHQTWPGMNQWIAQYVKGCATCQQNKIITHRKRTPPYRITTKENALPFRQVAMDLITGLPTHNGNDAILTIVDHGCSRAAIFLPCTTKITGPGIAQLYLDHVYRWFGLPTKVISDRDPRFTSHFGRSIAQKLQINQNLSTAFHPQTDGISERKNQWVEQYLRLITSAAPEDWTHWLALASAVHNNRKNETTGLSPNQILFGFETILLPSETPPSNNQMAEDRIKELAEKRNQAIDAINQTLKGEQVIPSQHQVGDQVWLEATNLKVRHQKTKLAPKRYGPFPIIKEISPVAYQLSLPATWHIHDVFHASLLSPYHENDAHGPNFSRPSPDLIDGEEEYEVERIISHRLQGRSKTLQYLIKWLGYPDADNTWEPAHQIHAPEMIKAYHRRTPLSAIKTLALAKGIQCLSPLSKLTPLSKPSPIPSNSPTETSSNISTPQPPGTPLPSTPPNPGTTLQREPSINDLIVYALQSAVTKTTTCSTAVSAKTSTASYTTRTCPTTLSRWRPNLLIAPQNLSTYDPFQNAPSPCPSPPSQHLSPSPWPTATKKPSNLSPKASSPPSKSTPKKSAKPTTPKMPASANWSRPWGASSPSSKRRTAMRRTTTRAPRISTSPSKTATTSQPTGSSSWTTGRSPPFPKNTPSPTHPTSATSTPTSAVPTTATKTQSYLCNRGSSSYSPAPPTPSTHYTKRPRSGATGKPCRRYNASENWSTPSSTHRAASTSSRLNYGAPSKPRMRLKVAWRRRALTAPSPTSAPYPTWDSGTSGSLGRTTKRGSLIVNEDIDI
jgi:hypothetical protein